jgi:hypothetical protein
MKGQIVVALATIKKIEEGETMVQREAYMLRLRQILKEELLEAHMIEGSEKGVLGHFEGEETKIIKRIKKLKKEIKHTLKLINEYLDLITEERKIHGVPTERPTTKTI